MKLVVHSTTGEEVPSGVVDFGCFLDANKLEVHVMRNSAARTDSTYYWFADLGTEVQVVYPTSTVMNGASNAALLRPIQEVFGATPEEAVENLKAFLSCQVIYWDLRRLQCPRFV